VAFPAYLKTLRLVRAFSKKANLLTEEEEAEIDELEKKLKILLEGGYAWAPRRKLDL